MKIKVIIVILAVACLGLGIAFFATKQQGEEQHRKDIDSMLDYSNQLVGVNVQLNDLRQVNLALTNDLAASQQQIVLTKEEVIQLSNSLVTAKAALASTTSTLASTESSLAGTKSTLASAQERITSLNTRVTDLEAQNKVLDQRVGELTNTIAQLNAAIENTKDQLAVAQTNSAFLQQELQKQMSQRAELEHKFNDLDELRLQVKKMRDEMLTARRLQFMKNDTSSKKGAELLIQRTVTTTNAPASKLPPSYDLNVEVGSDGSVKVIPPLNAATNSVAH